MKTHGWETLPLAAAVLGAVAVWPGEGPTGHSSNSSGSKSARAEDNEAFDLFQKEPGRVRLRVRGTPTDEPGELRLEFAFDQKPPQSVTIEVPGAGEGQAGKTLQVERKGPTSWRVLLGGELASHDDEFDVEWAPPPSGAELVEARWATAQDDLTDRPEQFYEDLKAIRALYPGSDAVSKARRFFLELDFVTCLMRDDFLRNGNQDAAERDLGIPVQAFLAEPTDIELQLEKKLIHRPLHRALGSVAGGSSSGLASVAVSHPDPVSSVATVFESLAERHYPDESSRAQDAARALLSFANGDLRRPPPAEGEPTGEFNCEPNGYLFVTFAEFAWYAMKHYETEDPDPAERAFWRTYWAASVAGIEVFGEVYRDRTMKRKTGAYASKYYSDKRAWSETELAALLERSLALDDEQVQILWGRNLATLFRDDHRMP